MEKPIINFKVESEQEKQEIKKRAKELHMSVSSYIRYLIFVKDKADEKKIG